ncbi:MAG: CarD family transcriptional regulator, partial [Actinomycetota bacterium]|nr:CarD family transcriptional regulator [Actinomycetota bacterium]
MATKKTAAKTTTSKASVKKAPVKKASAKKAPVKKASAKKAPVKKASVKKAPVKKASVKKAPVKKASVKKAPVKKASVKKAPVKKASVKKAPVKKAAAKPAAAAAPAARKAKAKAKADPFSVGDKVVYPHHGAATIVRKERREFKDEKQNFYVLEIATDQLIVSVPAASAVERGVRPVISKSKSRQVFQTLRGEPQEAGSNWSRWYKVLTEKINSGDIFQVAEVIRDLDYAQKIK